MEYFERFLKIILSVLKFFGIILSTIGVGLMMLIQIICIFLTFIITMCVLVPIEFFVIRPIYFIVTGNHLLDDCYGIVVMFEDALETATIRIKRIENESPYEHEIWRSRHQAKFYSDLWDKIKSIKIEIK